MAISTSPTGLAPNTKFLWADTQYWKQDAGKSYGVTKIDDDTLRFEVRAGDVWTMADSASINRAEIASTVQIANGTPIHVDYSMNIEKAGDSTAYWTVLGQFHQNDYPGAPRASPPFGINLSNGKMTVVIGYTNGAGEFTYKTVFADTAKVREGHEYKFSIDVTFDPNGKGHLSVVRDGVKIAEYDGPLGYPTQSSVYWKEGIYRPASSEPMAVSYSGLSIKTGTPIALSPEKITKPFEVNHYGADGKIASTTIENPDGSMSVKSYDSAGTTVSLVTKNLNGTTTTLSYDKAGAVVQKTVANGDTSRTVETFGITGKSYVSEKAVFDKTGQPVSVERYLADGKVEQQQTFGKYAVNTINQYDASGKVIFKSVTQANGTREETLSSIKGQDYANEQRSFDASGTLTKLVRTHDDGSLAYSQQLGSNGSMTYMAYDATGHLLRKSVTQTNGTREYTEYAAGDPVNATVRVQYDAAGNILKNTQVHSDGTVAIYIENIKGQSYTSETNLYDAKGKVVLVARYHADKTLDYKQEVGSNGTTTYSQYDAKGILTQKAVLAADGSRELFQYGLKDKGITSQHLIYDTKGTITKMIQVSDDGSRKETMNGIANKSYTTEESKYDAKDNLVSVVRYHADKTLDYKQEVGSNGATTYSQYDAKGILTQKAVLSLDGNREVTQYGITNKSYTTEETKFDAKGNVVGVTRLHADKSLDYKQEVGGDGATTYSKYDAKGALTQKAVLSLDGSREVSEYGGLKNKALPSSQVSYDTKGAMTKLTQFSDDGSKRTSEFGITGKSYTTENVSFDAKGNETNVTRYHADGTTDYIKTVGADGSAFEAFHDALGRQTLNVAQRTDGSQVLKSLASDVIMTSGKGNDIFYGFAQGKDKFVFHGDFGHDTIYSFNAGANGIQDLIQFDKSVAQDYAHLKLAQQGSDVVVSVTSGDSITLKGVALSQLSSHDFLFV